jgi:protein-tyrosine phosphatase
MARIAPADHSIQVVDLHFVTPDLAVGASFADDAVALLARDHGIDRVVDVRVEDRDDEELLRVHGIRLLHLPTQDCCAISPQHLREGVAFALGGMRRGERVFIHCEYGIGRSALLALCVLVARGVAPLEAMARLKDSRPAISPAPEQLAAFVEYCRELRAERGESWPVPGVERLSAIAWRHLFQGEGSVDPEQARAAATRRW